MSKHTVVATYIGKNPGDGYFIGLRYRLMISDYHNKITPLEIVDTISTSLPDPIDYNGLGEFFKDWKDVSIE